MRTQLAVLISVVGMSLGAVLEKIADPSLGRPIFLTCVLFSILMPLVVPEAVMSWLFMWRFVRKAAKGKKDVEGVWLYKTHDPTDPRFARFKLRIGVLVCRYDGLDLDLNPHGYHYQIEGGKRVGDPISSNSKAANVDDDFCYYNVFRYSAGGEWGVAEGAFIHDGTGLTHFSGNLTTMGAYLRQEGYRVSPNKVRRVKKENGDLWRENIIEKAIVSFDYWKK